MRKRAPTMKDVAREAGVALGTVSKVVNGLPVGKEYQKKVEAAIKRLDYSVNTYAKGLRAGKTHVIAFLVPDTYNPFYGTATYYIHRALLAQGYRMLLCITDSDTGIEQAMVAAMKTNKVDGVICYSAYSELLVPDGVPFVTIDRQLGAMVPCVASDNFSGGRLAAEKLLEAGCRRLAWLSIGTSAENEPYKRGDGFLSCCAAKGVSCEMLMLKDGEPFSLITEFLSNHIQNGKSEIDGIFCVTDLLARQVMDYLRDHGLKVPEDVQLIGYDGVKDIATGRYACSTIIQPIEQIAETAVSIVLSDDWLKRLSLICMPVSYGNGGTLKTDFLPDIGSE